jgi:hypothetical protein
MKHLGWRHLIVWLLLLAVPLRAAAAVTMVGCQNHHDMVAVAAFERVQTESSHPCAHAAVDQSENDVSTGAGEPVLKCTSCAPCCMSAIVAGLEQVESPSPTARAMFGAAMPTYRSADVPGLDRPPNLIVA